MQRMTFSDVVKGDEKKIIKVVGYFKSEFDAEQVANVPEWQAKGAWVVGLIESPGDKYAVLVQR